MFSPNKIGARIFVEVIVQKWLNCESFPILALGPVPELIQCHQLVLILRPIIVAVPVNKDTNRGEPNIGSDCHIPEETLLINDALFTFKFNFMRNCKVRVPWRLIHDIWVGGIKTQSSSRKAVSDKAHPKKLN